MDQQALQQRVIEIIAEQLGKNAADIQLDASFIDDLGADSLDTVELVMALEDNLGIEIPDDDANTINTVRSAVEYAQKHVQA